MAHDNHKAAAAQGLRDVFVIRGRRPRHSEHGGQAENERECAGGSSRGHEHN